MSEPEEVDAGAENGGCLAGPGEEYVLAPFLPPLITFHCPSFSPSFLHFSFFPLWLTHLARNYTASSKFSTYWTVWRYMSTPKQSECCNGLMFSCSSKISKGERGLSRTGTLTRG